MCWSDSKDVLYRTIRFEMEGPQCVGVIVNMFCTELYALKWKVHSLLK